MKNFTLKILAGLALVVGAGSANAATYSDSYAISNRPKSSKITEFGVSTTNYIYLKDSRSAGSVDGTFMNEKCTAKKVSSILAYGKNDKSTYFLDSRINSGDNIEYGVPNTYGGYTSSELAEINFGETSDSQVLHLSQKQLDSIMTLAASKGYTGVRFTIGTYLTKKTCSTTSGTIKTSTTIDSLGITQSKQRFWYVDANVPHNDASLEFYAYKFKASTVSIEGSPIDLELVGTTYKDTLYLHQGGLYSYYDTDLKKAYYSAHLSRVKDTTTTYFLSRHTLVDGTSTSPASSIDTYTELFDIYGLSVNGISYYPTESYYKEACEDVFRENNLAEGKIITYKDTPSKNCDIFSDSLVTGGYAKKIRIGASTHRYKTVEGDDIYDTTYSNALLLYANPNANNLSASLAISYATKNGSMVSSPSTLRTLDFTDFIDTVSFSIVDGVHGHSSYVVLQYADASNGTSNLSWKDLAVREVFGNSAFHFDYAFSIRKDGLIEIKNDEMKKLISGAQIYSKATAFRIKSVFKDFSSTYEDDSPVEKESYSSSIVINRNDLSQKFVKLTDDEVISKYRNASLVSKFGFTSAGAISVQDGFGGSTAYDRKYVVTAYGVNDTTTFFFKNGLLDYGTPSGVSTKLTNASYTYTSKTAAASGYSFNNLVKWAEEEASKSGYSKIRFILTACEHRTANSTGSYTSSFNYGTEGSFFVDYVVPPKIKSNLKFVGQDDETYINTVSKVQGKNFDYTFSLDGSYYGDATLLLLKTGIKNKKVTYSDTTENSAKLYSEFKGTLSGENISKEDSVAYFKLAIVTKRFTDLDGNTVYDTLKTESVGIANMHALSVDTFGSYGFGSAKSDRTGLIPHGDNVTVSASFNSEKSKFLYWSDGKGNAISQENPFTLALYSDSTIRAVFALQESGGSNSDIEPDDVIRDMYPSYMNIVEPINTEPKDTYKMDFVLGYSSVQFNVTLSDRLKKRHFVLQYCNVTDPYTLDAVEGVCKYEDIYWGYIDKLDANGETPVDVPFIEVSANGSLYEISPSTSPIKGNLLGISNVNINKMYGVFKLQVFEMPYECDTYSCASNEADRANLVEVPRKMKAYEGSPLEIVVPGFYVRWCYGVRLIGENLQTIAVGVRPITNSSYTLPSDKSLAKVPEGTDLESYGFHWENTFDKTDAHDAGSVISLYNFATYKIVLDTNYRVQFLDFDGDVLKSSMVRKGSAAEAPENPNHDGDLNYTFESWDKDFSNVIEPLDVTAQYKEVISYVAKKEIRANQCGDLWCGVKQDNRVNTGFTAEDEGAGYWFDYDDGGDEGGDSKVEYAVGTKIEENIQAAYAIDASFVLGNNAVYAYAGIGFNIGAYEGYDISNWNGVCIAYTSDNAISIELTPSNENEFTQYNNPLASLSKSSSVSFVNLPWSVFKQGNGWGIPQSTSDVVKTVQSIKIRSAGKSANFKLVTLGRYGTCNGESYVAKKEIEEEKCGDLWCGVKQETLVNAGYNSEGGFAGEWFTYSDRDDGGNSTVELAVGAEISENISNAYSIEGTFDLKSGIGYPYAGIGFNVGNSEKGYDVSDWDGVCVAYKSSQALYIDLVPLNDATLTGYNNYKAALPKSDEVVFRDLLWNKFKQEDWWGTKVDISVVLKQLQGVRIVKRNGTGETDFKIVSIGRYGTCDGQKKIVLDESAISEGLDLSKLDIDEKTFVKIPEGKQFYANKKIYSGILDAYQLEDLVDVTLKPISGVSLETNDEGELQAGLSGALYTDKMIIPEDIEVDHVDINRTFTVDVAGTLVVPFSADVTSDMGDFIDVKKIEKVDGVWVATGNRVNRIEAHHPYVVRAASSTISFDDVIIEKNEDVKPSVNFGYNWTFNGAYNGKMWTDDDPEKGYAYGFAAAKQGNIEVGQFVKFATNGKIAPMRAYLVYNKTPRANAKPGYGVLQKAAIAEEEPPKSIVLRIVDEILDNTDSEEKVENKDASEDKTLIVIELQNATSEKADRWFDVLGHKLKNKPTVKGTYIKNGKPVSVK